MRKQTSSQTIGPFFHHVLTPESYGRSSVFGNVLAAEATDGQRIRVKGRLLKDDGQPFTAAMVEIWQANAQGRYPEPDRDECANGPGFVGFGRAATDERGAFMFETVKPGATQGRGNALQAPHINIVVFASRLDSHLFTRLYFSDEDAANLLDPVLASIDRDRRRTLIAQRGGLGVAEYVMDIIVGGTNETVFFDL